MPRSASPRFPIDLSVTTPTRLVEQLSIAATHARAFADDPLNALDNNPAISREWRAVERVLARAAVDLHNALNILFDGDANARDD